ncbi:uncharacterized protein LOC125318790 [Corvus hawaiiensis]|uniref:uncharacterized protein LOC125318790 n=1 Tax=Corvus hawaiiensis TaxID=134902 RepID=UPI0020186362|nr:uncharacterized protein LOC125318790 [Corvus hawaiiensis]
MLRGKKSDRIAPRGLLKNTLAAEKMVPLVARSNRVDERGRGVESCGGKNPQNGIIKLRSWKCLRSKIKSKDPWREGRSQCVNWRNPRTYFCTLHAFSDARCLTRHITLLVLTLYLNEASATESLSHQPFKWSLIRWEDQKVIQTVTTPSNPSFSCQLCDLIQVKPCLNKKGFYFCPASNPGKTYCNWPGRYYCAYWGCETVAFGFSPGGGKDKYIKVGWRPSGCQPPEVGPDTGIKQGGNCHGIQINVTNKMDSGWAIGKTWGARLWESGTNRGGHFLIKREEIPPSAEAIGPNVVINPPIEIQSQGNRAAEEDHTAQTPTIYNQSRDSQQHG